MSLWIGKDLDRLKTKNFSRYQNNDHRKRRKEGDTNRDLSPLLDEVALGIYVANTGAFFLGEVALRCGFAAEGRPWGTRKWVKIIYGYVPWAKKIINNNNDNINKLGYSSFKIKNNNHETPENQYKILKKLDHIKFIVGDLLWLL